MIEKEGFKIEDFTEALKRLEKKKKKKSKEEKLREYVYNVALSHYRKNGKRVDKERMMFLLEKFWKYNPQNMNVKLKTERLIKEEITRAKQKYFYEKRKKEKIEEEVRKEMEDYLRSGIISYYCYKTLLEKFFGLKDKNLESSNGITESNSIALYKILNRIKEINPAVKEYINHIIPEILEKEKISNKKIKNIIKCGD